MTLRIAEITDRYRYAARRYVCTHNRNQGRLKYVQGLIVV